MGKDDLYYIFENVFSILHCNFVYVYLWLIPHPNVFMTHLRACVRTRARVCMCVCIYIYLQDVGNKHIQYTLQLFNEFNYSGRIHWWKILMWPSYTYTLNFTVLNSVEIHLLKFLWC